MDNDTKYDGLVGTGKLNSEELIHNMQQFSSVEDFLSNEDVRLSFHATSISSLEQDVLLQKDFDLDGIVVELRCFAAVKSPIFYLLLDKPKPGFSQLGFHLIKKHIEISKLSQSELERMKKVRCAYVAYIRDWRITLSLIPDRLHVSNSFESVERAKAVFEEFIRNVCDKFSVLLKNLPESEFHRPTLRKNGFNDLAHMNILPQDQDFMLGLLDRAVRETKLNAGTKVLIFASKFGMKDRAPMILSDDFFIEKVHSISVHSACTISCNTAHTHLLWSRQGLYEIIGTRGQLFGCLGFREAANFQTNLDARQLDISGSLRNIAKYSDRVTFLQLYSDTPHLHTDLAFPNPVTGSLATSGLLHPQTTQSMDRRCVKYMGTMEENARKLVGLISNRIEIVSKLDSPVIPSVIKAEGFFNVDKISQLFEEKSLILPFYQIEDEHPVIQQLQRIVSTLCSNLRDLWVQNKHKGRYCETWKSFQIELALENFFYGKSLVYSNEIFSTNLGPGMKNERSLTMERGFLGLDLPTCCSLPDSPPPLSLWVKKSEQRDRVKRIFGLTDHLQSSEAELGGRLIKILIMDLYGNSSLSMHTLRSTYQTIPGKIKGSITCEHLAHLLAVVKRYKYPFTFGRALTFVAEANRDLELVILSGLAEADIKYFPAIKVWDESRNEKITWNKTDFWEISRPQIALSIAARAGEIGPAVLVQLVNRRLNHARNLEVFKENDMPWLIPILRRLEGQNLDKTKTITVCTFLSAIALLQQHVYIDYNKLAYLQLDLPISQTKLRLLEIQSHRLIGLNNVRIWRLKENIPIKVCAKTDKRRNDDKKKVTYPASEHAPDDDAPDEDYEPLTDAENQQVEIINVRTLPVQARGMWTSQELALLERAQEIDSSTFRRSYQVYVRLCCKEGIPSRPFNAFKSKALRIAK